MISWGPWGGKQDPDAEFTRCRPEVLGGPVLCSQALGATPLAETGSEDREPSTAFHARLDWVRGVSSTQFRATTMNHMWPQQMFQVPSSSGAEIVLTHPLECLSSRFCVCNNRKEKGIPNSGKLNIPAHLADGTLTRFNLI